MRDPLALLRALRWIHDPLSEKPQMQLEDTKPDC